MRRFWPLAVVVTAFTVAHSITLFCAAFGYAPDALWFPPLIETLIAVSIVYMALENIVLAARPEGSGRPGVSRRWMIAFAFGLVHGFGFSFALQETLQFAGAHVVTSLFAFNVGVELGQLLVLALLAPLLWLAFRLVPERVGVIIASALVGAHRLALDDRAWIDACEVRVVAARSCWARNRGPDTDGRRGDRRGALGLDAAPRAAGGHRGSPGVDMRAVRTSVQVIFRSEIADIAGPSGSRPPHPQLGVPSRVSYCYVGTLALPFPTIHTFFFRRH